MSVRIPIERRGEIVAHTLVDDADAHLAAFTWRLASHGYVRRSAGRSARLYLHREVLGLVPGDGWQADHINGDKLDNRRSNLRRVTALQNGQNRGGKAMGRQRGVSWSERRQCWLVRLRINGTLHILGEYTDEREATRVAREFLAQQAPFSQEARAA